MGKYTVCIGKELFIENPDEMISHFEQGWERDESNIFHTSIVTVQKDFCIETYNIKDYIKSINTLTDMHVKYAFSEDHKESWEYDSDSGEYINVARIWTFNCFSIKDGTQDVIFYGEGDTYEEALENANIGEDYEVNESYQFYR